MTDDDFDPFGDPDEDDKVTAAWLLVLAVIACVLVWFARVWAGMFP